MKVIIAPYSAKLRNGKPNPKSYPVRYWEQVVTKLNAMNVEVIQIGVAGETRIEGVSQFVQNWPLAKLGDLINHADTWISVDSFLPHFCFSERLKPGIVIWGPSSHEIFGHPENTNLEKDPKYRRPLQWQDWNQCEYNEAAFVLPQVVVDAVLNHVSNPSRTQPADRTIAFPDCISLAGQTQETANAV